VSVRATYSNRRWRKIVNALGGGVSKVAQHGCLASRPRCQFGGRAGQACCQHWPDFCLRAWSAISLRAISRCRESRHRPHSLLR